MDDFQKTPRPHFENFFLRATQLERPQRIISTALKQTHPPILILRWRREPASFSWQDHSGETDSTTG